LGELAGVLASEPNGMNRLDVLEAPTRSANWHRATPTRTRSSMRAAQRRHDLLYGAASLTRPNRLPAANWPASQTGRGSLPHDWPSWREFWGRAVTNPSTAEL
jgi:hypothetical protein